ncbi:Acetyl-CoA transporter [Phaffia rhodozyma]|uniref:Acetyl-CoA transporter n=1 Tax=Phaffia rhodozyma TaxID=264483 RepID=A0A0F7SEB8_PHARH|nr:Acetyl-CoA transporter [Phaffia rhodozyma]
MQTKRRNKEKSTSVCEVDEYLVELDLQNPDGQDYLNPKISYLNISEGSYSGQGISYFDLAKLMVGSSKDQASDFVASEQTNTASTSSTGSTTATKSPSMLSSSLRPRTLESPMDLAERNDGSYASREVLDHRPIANGHERKRSLTRKVEGSRLHESMRMVNAKSSWLDKVLLSGKDRKSFLLLILLYLLQGIPIGLTFGTLPFLLKPKLSYSQLALLSLSTYPYSLKLLWSPIVDSCFSAKVGRRKSWILPVQMIMGFSMWWLGTRINEWLEREVPNVTFLTFIFVSLIFFAATQDIAVDGWALTLLSHENLSYASTAQTIGLNSGYFLSFTVFLAFNSVEFGNKYFRSTPLETPLITLGGYLKFWSLIYFAVTVWLFKFQKEDPVSDDDPDMDIKKVYKVMYSIVKLKHVQSFIILHLVAKIGFMANDAVTSLKLLEKGFLKEDMAVAVLIDFPFQIIGGWVAASWSQGTKPLNPWVSAFSVRLFFGLLAMALVYGFPTTTPIPSTYFILVILFTVIGSFTSTVQFVGISAFHTQIADPIIGGTYMTLLNTVSNLGGTWPKPIVLQGVDYFSTATCRIKDDVVLKASECVSEHGKAACTALGGVCTIERDGYYVVSALCVSLGAILLVGYVIPTARKLQALPQNAWKVPIPQ